MTTRPRLNDVTAALLVKLAAEAKEQLQRKPVPRRGKILFIPSYYMIDFTVLHDFVMALSLRLRGFELAPVLTQFFYPDECTFYGGLYKGDRDEAVQGYSQIERWLWQDVLECNARELGEFVGRHDNAIANTYSEAVTLENYLSISRDNYDVGLQAAFVTNNMNNLSHLINDPGVQRQLRIHVENIVRLQFAYEKIFPELSPDLVYSNVPFYYHWGVPFHKAKQLGIPLYSAQFGERKNTFLYNRDCASLLDCSPAWETFSEQSWSKEFEDLFEYCLEKRRSGMYAHFSPQATVKSGKPPLKERLSIPPEKKVIYFPANLAFDAVVFRPAPSFENFFQMVGATIDFLRERPDYHLILKAHPSEKVHYQGGALASRHCLRQHLVDQSISLPPNVTFLDCDTDLSSYEILAGTDAVVAFTSSVVVEAAWFKIPAISVADAHYNGKGFAVQPRSRTEYFDLIDRYLSKPLSAEEASQVAERSRKYFLLFSCYGSVDLGLCQGSDCGITEDKLLFDSISKLLPGENKALDYVCDSIIARQPIFGDGRWPPLTLVRESIETSSVTEKSDLTPLGGFDEHGEVLMAPEVVYRGIFPNSGDRVRRILRDADAGDFSRLGIIPAKIAQSERDDLRKYEMVLEHPRLALISYAHEWCYEGLRAAVLRMLEIQERLFDHGYVLKDFGATQNILFDGTNPIWIDFLSLTSFEDLPTESWLLEGLPVSLYSEPFLSCFFHQIIRRVFEPHSLYPLLLLPEGATASARREIRNTSMNISDRTLSKGDLHSGQKDAARLLDAVEGVLQSRLRSLDLKGLLQDYRSIISEVGNPFGYSGYVDYYRDKGEEFDFTPSADWKPKQRVVYDALRAVRPTSVLDIGANTGWFSILASRMGATVTALEIDEACANVLFRKAQKERGKITPLVADILDLHDDIPAWSGYQADQPTRYKLSEFSNQPILLSQFTRFQSDLVLALAIFHHLVLGAGRSVEESLSILCRLARKCLVLEFVDPSDPLITGEPDFFPALKANRGQLDGYHLERVLTIMRGQFREVRCEKVTETRFALIATR
jgi:SAM-dependent methyltransferase